MAERGQVAHCGSHPAERVEGDGGQVPVTAVDQAQPGQPRGLLEVAPAHPARTQQDPVDLRGEGLHERQLAVGRLLRIGQQQMHPVLAGPSLGALEQRRIEGVQQVGDDHAEGAAAARGELPRGAGGTVAELEGDLLDPVAGILADHLGAAEGAGDRRDRHPCLLRDVPQRHPHDAPALPCSWCPCRRPPQATPIPSATVRSCAAAAKGARWRPMWAARTSVYSAWCASSTVRSRSPIRVPSASVAVRESP